MRLNIIFGVTLFVFLTTGCAMTYRAGIYPIPSDLQIKEFQGEGEAISFKSEPIEGVIFVGAVGVLKYYADIKQVTDVTVSFLGEELSKRGFSVRRDATKSITLNVAGMTLTHTIGSCQCNIKIEYATSDGYRRIYFAYNSGGLCERACDGAITKGVANLLNDEKLIDFLKSKER